MRFRLAVLVSAALASPTLSIRAQQMDLDLMTKWSAFTIIHYVVVGEYSGAPLGTGSSATDRVELTFDWNQNEMVLVGTLAIKNFPGTATPPAPGGPCPTMRVRFTSAYDHFALTTATPMANTLQLKGTRSHPATVAPQEVGSKCVETPAPGRTEEVTIRLDVLPTVVFGMPAALGEGKSISKDGKSIVAVDREFTGWTWTYTPTGVR